MRTLPMNLSRSLFLAFTLTFFATITTYAETPTRKIIGRGTEDRKTGETLRLICAGNLDSETNEQSCSKIRFLVESQDGAQEQIIGPTLSIDVDAPLKKQLKQELKRTHLRAPFATKFPMTTALYVPSASNYYIGGWFFMAGLVQITRIQFSLGQAAITTTGNLLGPLALGLPILVDLLTMPFRKDIWGITGLDKEVTVRALQSRKVEAWQLLPRKISHRNFSLMLKRLAAVGESSVYSLNMNASETDLAYQSPTPLDAHVISSDSDESLDTALDQANFNEEGTI